MSDLIGDGGQKSGQVFAGVPNTPVGVAAGVLPCNGTLASLATYPTITYLNNNLGWYTGPAYIQLAGASLFAPYYGGQNMHVDSSVIGPYHILCGSSYSGANQTGAAITFSTDIVNWTLGQINSTPGSFCVGIAKLGNTYYATVAGTTSGQDFIYSSANLTVWTLAFTYPGGSPIYGISQMAASASVVVSLQGGCDNCTFFNGINWIFDRNGVGGAGTSSILNVLSTGEVGGVTVMSPNGASPVTLVAWKVAAGNTATTVHVVDAALTGSLLDPTLAGNTTMGNGAFNCWNYKLSYVGNHYVINAFGIVYTSPDFDNWTKQADMQFIAMENIGGTLYGIALSGGVNKYYSSPDGIDWTLYFTSALNQGFNPWGFGARILQISPTLWAVCSSVEDGNVTNGVQSGYNGSSIAFIFNPLTEPVVQQSFLSDDICRDDFKVNALGTGILAGNYSIIPTYNPAFEVQLPTMNANFMVESNATQPSMFMII